MGGFNLGQMELKTLQLAVRQEKRKGIWELLPHEHSQISVWLPRSQINISSINDTFHKKLDLPRPVGFFVKVAVFSIEVPFRFVLLLKFSG